MRTRTISQTIEFTWPKVLETLGAQAAFVTACAEGDSAICQSVSAVWEILNGDG